MGYPDPAGARFAAFRGRYVALIAASLFVSALAVALTMQSEAASDPVIVAAGDICGSPIDCAPTAALIDQINPDRVLTLGDNAYPDGTLAQYTASYAPNWGRFKGKTSPSPGNHEYDTANAQGYFAYFGGSAAPGPYYSYDVGAWHLISLTGDISVSAGSAQETWLKADLAAHPNPCILAFWHEPRFSSGVTHGSDAGFDPFWRDLYAAGADIILNGHEHNYERFAPQNPSGTATATGIREFVVGTGGVSHGYSFGTPVANSEVRNNTTWGVIKLTLHAASYDWQFVPVAGGTFTDSGSGSCSAASPAPTTTATTTAATTTTATTTTSTTGSSTTRAAPAFRYIYNSDSAPATVASYGWNLIDVGSKSSADQLPARARGLMWVGDYDNSTCAWETSDSALKTEVSAAVGDAKVFGYFLSDEPNPYACPHAPAQHKARSDLIHSLDPTKPTVITLDSNGFKGRATQDALDQLPLWKGTADYIGLDPYPCYQGSACDFSWIDKTIQAANAAGLNYWGVVQAFNDSSWRWPTADELSHMLNQWAASKESGSMTFAWTWNGNNLSGKSALLDIFRHFNAGAAQRRCVVPKVLGLTLARARVAVARANCIVGKVSKRYSSRRRGHVIAQHPKQGTRLANRGRVNLVISKGRPR